MIKKCTCVNEYQDRKYGKGMRVHTTGKKDGDRCTVCGPVSGPLKRAKMHAAGWTPMCSLPPQKQMS